MQVFFAATLLVSAMLLFVVEPMFAKKVLPLLGGSPSVWNTCLVFYQAALLAGYLYAHCAIKWLGARRAVVLHAVLLCLPWLVLALPTSVPPLGLLPGWTPPRDGSPVLWLWLMLTLRLGLPFLVVSSTAPMLQAWFVATGHRAAKDPYFLYAASNLGSMIGLAAYPLVIEPQLTLTEQSWWWTGGYGLLMALVTGCAMLFWMSRRGGQAATLSAAEEDPPAEQAGEAAEDVVVATVLSDERPTLVRRLRWLTLALIPSSLLLGVTMHISTDIASMPLLWAMPLGLYLLSFVLVFARRQLIRRSWMAGLQAALLVIVAGTFFLTGNSSSEIAAASLLHMLAFFATAMVCHGELADDRPAARYLTEFYLWLSLGGVVGGLLNALVAPLVFKTVLEYPLMLVAACLFRPRPRDAYGTLSAGMGIVLAVFGLVVLYHTAETMDWSALSREWSSQWDKLEGAGPSRVGDCWAALGQTWKLQLAGLAAMAAMIVWLSAATIFAQLRAHSGREEWALRFTLETVPATRQFALRAGPFDMVLLAVLALLTTVVQLAGRDQLDNRVFATELVGLAAVAVLGFARRPVVFAAGVAVLLGLSFTCAGGRAAMYCARSFYGVLRVDVVGVGDEKAHRLLHGSTMHGTQLLDPDDRWEPSTYYHRTGPVGEIFEELANRPSFAARGRIGVVGLGTGTIAAYGQRGQRLTYFEIDAAVQRIAEDRKYFTYLSDLADRGGRREDGSPLAYEIVLGDARLRLADAPDGEFDVLLIDAFSSDAIPVHLLTREAVELYKQKLAHRGLLAIHISNRHLNLRPVVGNLAADENVRLAARVWEDDDESYPGKSRSTWVVLARDLKDLGGLDLKKWKELKTDPTQPVWTDDFSNIVSVLNRDMKFTWLPGWKLWQQWKDRAGEEEEEEE